MAYPCVFCGSKSFIQDYLSAYGQDAADDDLPRACVRLLRKVMQLQSLQHLDMALPFADSDLLLGGLEPSAQLRSLHLGCSCFDVRYSLGLFTLQILPHLGTLRSLVVNGSGDVMNTIELLTVAGRRCKKLSHLAQFECSGISAALDHLAQDQTFCMALGVLEVAPTDVADDGLVGRSAIAVVQLRPLLQIKRWSLGAVPTVHSLVVYQHLCEEAEAMRIKQRSYVYS